MSRRTRRTNPLKGHKVPRSLKRLFPNVTSVEDAGESVVVDVNTRDCSTGIKSSPGECAMAKAVKRQFHAEGAVIGLSVSYVIKDGKALRFKTPQSVQREIVSFDRNQDFAPGTYQLNRPAPSERMGTKWPKRIQPGRHDNNKAIVHDTVRVRALARGTEVL